MRVVPRHWARRARLQDLWRCLGLFLGVGLAVGCKDEGNRTPAPDPEPKPLEFRTRAHRDAYGRLLPLAETALIAADPVGAFRRGLAGPKPPPLSASRRAEVQSNYEVAWREAVDIDGEALEPTEDMLLTGIRFALSRVHDAKGAEDPARRSLLWSVTEARRFVSSLEWALATSDCSGCPTALQSLTAELDAAAQNLGGTSAPTLAAAESELTALAHRIRNLAHHGSAGDLQRASATVAADVDDLVQRVKTWREGLPAEPTSTWNDPLPPARGKSALARLPDRLGAKALRRRLDVEEAITASAEQLFRRLGPTLGRLAAMAEKVADGPAQAESPVTVERCRAILERAVEVARKHPQLESLPVDCPSLLEFWGQQSRTDAELTLDVVRWGVLEPARIARLHDEASVLALVTGRIAPESHALTATVAILMSMQDGPAASLALRRATDAACLAATALWIHGELGSDDALVERLQQQCPRRPPSAWIADAEARPRDALAGLGLVHVDGGPAEVVALERYWWAPLGLVERLANPRRKNAPARPVDVKVEPIVPELREPSEREAPP